MRPRLGNTLFCSAHPAGTANLPYSAPWTCTYDVYGCSDINADNYLSYVTQPTPGMCQYGGCNDTDATNFNNNVSDSLF